MKQTRKFLSLLLALVLCLGLLPVTAMAKEDLADRGVITDTRGENHFVSDSSEGSQQSFTITFNVDGGKFSDGSTTKTVKSSADGVPFTEVPVCDLKQSTFMHWVADDGTVWTPEEIPGMRPTKDTTLNAMWTIAIITDNKGSSGGGSTSFTITFDAGGGKFADGSKTKSVQSTSSGIPFTEVPTRDSFTFKGWKSSDRAQTIPYTPEDIASAQPRRDSTLTAVWEAASGSGAPAGMVITLDPAGGTVSPNKLTMDNAGKVTQPLPTPTRNGYEFAGWYLGEWKVEQDTAYTGPNTLTAHWTKPGLTEQKPVRVNFDPDGGTITEWKGKKVPALKAGQPPFAVDNDTGVDQNSGRGWTLTDEYGQLSALPAAEKSGLTLDGWYQGSTKVTESTVFKADANLTAKWTKADPNGPFTVKFDLGYKNAPKTETPKDLSVAKGSVMDLPDGKKLTPPAANYEFYAWCLQADDGKLYPWNEQHTVSADMTLVAGWVRKGTTVKAGEAVPEVSGTAAPSASGKSAFTDVPATSPFAKAIAWAVEKGITNGTTPTTFSPGTTCSTGHILTFLWRANGSPEPTIENPYKDEIPNAFKKAAIWAHEKGLVSGDTFGSATPCTRAASVTYMWKLAGSPEAKAASFKDVSASSDYAKAISWAVEKGVTKGAGDGTTFSPENICTRGQIVTFLNRAYAE